MEEPGLIPHLFRAEYSKLVAVLCKRFGIEHLELAGDIVSETFLMAAETWGLKGAPPNPTAWLYTVSKNKAIDYFRRANLFDQKISRQIAPASNGTEQSEIDLSEKNISDSQLQMMFAVCHPTIPAEAQIGLALNVLCGFGIEEIADAFLSNRDTIYKRLARAKEKLRSENIAIELPPPQEINKRLKNVLTTLYLLFNEGYYSASQNTNLRKDLCIDAMRLTLMLVNNSATNVPQANALLALMCFHASRFEARIGVNGQAILYDGQDPNLWDKALIEKGEYYLNLASIGTELSKYHLEAGIAYWHTQKNDTAEKWNSILQLYDKLLQLDYSPMAALNRTYALAKAQGNVKAIAEAELLNLNGNHLYHSLLGSLYSGIDKTKALQHLTTALQLARSANDKATLKQRLHDLKG